MPAQENENDDVEKIEAARVIVSGRVSFCFICLFFPVPSPQPPAVPKTKSLAHFSAASNVSPLPHGPHACKLKTIIALPLYYQIVRLTARNKLCAMRVVPVRAPGFKNEIESDAEALVSK